LVFRNLQALLPISESPYSPMRDSSCDWLAWSQQA
jgi:hypothetical protein